MAFKDIVEYDGIKYVDITPDMTSNTTPVPYVASCSSYYKNNGMYNAFAAFDNEFVTYGWATNCVPQGWVKLDFSKNTTINGVMMYIRTYSGRDNTPNVFTIEGSYDDETYNTIKSCSDITWEDTKQKFFKFDKPINYRYYRITVTKSNKGDSEDYIDIAELRYLQEVPYYLIKDNTSNKYYTYNNDSKSLEEVPDKSIINTNRKNCIADITSILPLLSELSSDLTIISNNNDTLNVNGIKVDKSMIATMEPLSMAAYETIHNITADYTTENNGAIKLIFSFDKGNTWKTYDVSTNVWNTVSVNIPSKLYDNFTSEEKSNWDSARDIILSDGISVQNLGNVVFSTETIKTLMFAVAFSRPTYADTCTLRGLNIKYDGVVTYIQLAVGSDLTKYEAKVRITGDTIGVTSSTNCDKLLISVVTNV